MSPVSSLEWSGKASHLFLRWSLLRLQLTKRLPVILKLLNFVGNFFKTLIFAASFFQVFEYVTFVPLTVITS